MQHCSLLGLSTSDATSRASTRPNDSATGTSSSALTSPGSGNAQRASIAATASSRESSICFEWSLMQTAFPSPSATVLPPSTMLD